MEQRQQAKRERRQRAMQQRQQVMQLMQQQAFEELFARTRGNDLTGLTAERIEKFEHFAADDSLVGEQCIVCLVDLEVGTQMVRLDCHVSHYLCKSCTDEWFRNHKTCPTCNHIFN